MRFSLGLPICFSERPDSPLEYSDLTAIARAAEDAGFYSVHAADHPLPSDRWLATGGHHSPDPLVSLSFVAAATTRLRLLTNILVIPYRSAGVVAKTVATLDRLSNGRVILGVGTGYEEGEFAALGVDFASRNELTDSSLRRITSIWSGESFLGNTARPTPTQKPRPRIWVGGNSRRAMRRAVDCADGWMPMVNLASQTGRRRTSAIETIHDLRRRVEELNAYCGSVGRTEPVDLSFTTLSPVPARRDERWNVEFLAMVQDLTSFGVLHLRLDLTGATRADAVEQIGEFGRTVVGLAG